MAYQLNLYWLNIRMAPLYGLEKNRVLYGYMLAHPEWSLTEFASESFPGAR